MKRSMQLAILLCSTTGISFQVHAQESNATAANADDAQASGDIIVTAQRKSESLQRVPLAVTALGGDALQKVGATGLADIAARVPSLNLGQQYGGAKITIRGIGLDSLAVGAEAPIAYHQDGVFIQRTAAGMISLFDVDRLEVLRGPQGTLYGRNATGGALNVITRDPTSSLDGYIRLTGGTYGLFASEGAISGPITEGVNARISFRTSDHSGFGTNLVTGHDIDNQKERAVRGKIEFRPTERLRILLAADYANANDRLGVAWHYLGQGGSNPLPTGVLLGGTLTTRIRDVSSEVDPLRKIEAWGTSAALTYDLDFAVLKSITAYRRTKSQARMDLDGTSFQLFSPMTAQEDGRQFSQEFQLTGTAGNTDWLVGLFHFNEKDVGSVSSPIFNGTFVSQGYYAGSQISTNAQAIFGQITQRFGGGLSATVGARYSTERKSVIDQQAIDLFTPASSPYRANYNPGAFIAIECSAAVQTLAVCNPAKRWNAFTPKFGVEYQVTPTTLLYASATKGFRSGTYSLGAVQAPVNPETVWSYEAGIKSRLVGDALRMNLAGFYYDYTNLQVTKAAGTQTVLENAATARIRGLEAEIIAKPIPQFQLDLTGSYLNAKFTKYVSADPARPAGDGITLDNGVPAFNLAGNRLPQAPELSFLAGAQYTIESSLGSFTLRGEIAHTSRVYFSAFNRPEVSEARHDRINAYLNFATPDNKWTLSVVGRNLTNKVAPTNAYVTTDLVGYIINANIEQPRTVEVTVGLNF